MQVLHPQNKLCYRCLVSNAPRSTTQHKQARRTQRRAFFCAYAAQYTHMRIYSTTQHPHGVVRSTGTHSTPLHPHRHAVTHRAQHNTRYTAPATRCAAVHHTTQHSTRTVYAHIPTIHTCAPAHIPTIRIYLLYAYSYYAHLHRCTRTHPHPLRAQHTTPKQSDGQIRALWLP